MSVVVVEALRDLVQLYRAVRVGAPYLWVGSKWELTPYLLPLYPVHRHHGVGFAGTAPEMLLKPPEWTSGMELLNDWHEDVANFLMVMANLPLGSFAKFCKYWNRLAGGVQVMYEYVRVFYQSRELWMKLPYWQRAALWAWINRQRFVGQWGGPEGRDPGIFIGNWRSERKRGVAAKSTRVVLTRQTTPMSSSPGGCRKRIGPSTWEWYHQRLGRPNVEVRCKDFFKIFTEFDIKGMFWSLDPIYKGAKRAYAGQVEAPSEEFGHKFVDALEMCHGLFLASVRMWPELAELATRERYMVIPTKRVTSLGNLKERKGFKEYIVMNYDPWVVKRCCEVPLQTPKFTQQVALSL